MKTRKHILIVLVLALALTLMACEKDSSKAFIGSWTYEYDNAGALADECDETFRIIGFETELSFGDYLTYYPVERTVTFKENGTYSVEVIADYSVLADAVSRFFEDLCEEQFGYRLSEEELSSLGAEERISGVVESLAAVDDAYFGMGTYCFTDGRITFESGNDSKKRWESASAEIERKGGEEVLALIGYFEETIYFTRK